MQIKKENYRHWDMGAAALLFIFFLTRIHNLLALPIFLDEASHITRAQYVWQDKPLYLLSTGKVLAPYLMAIFWPFQGPVFLGRFVVILLGLIGIAACYAIGRELYSRQAGLLAMVLWIVCPQLLFLERMALVDTTISSMAMLALWIAIRMIRSGRKRTAILCGVGLTLCVLAKTTGIVFLPIPVLVALLIKSPVNWKNRVLLVGIAYATVFMLLLAPVLYIRQTGDDPTGLKYGLTTTNTDKLGTRLQANATKALNAEQVYFSIPMLWVMIIGAAAATLYVPRVTLLLLPLVGALLLAIIATAVSLWLRYISPAAPFLLLLTAIGLIALADALRESYRIRLVTLLPWAVAAVWAIVIGIPFLLTAYRDPSKLPLPAGDRTEYIEWIPSGYGLQPAVDYLQQIIKQPTTVIVTAVNCDGARMYVPYDSPVKLVCPGVDWGGGNYSIISDIQQRVNTEGQVYVLGEDAPIVAEYELPAPLTVLGRFPRPNGLYAVKLYQIRRAGNLATTPNTSVDEP
ncbi:MAG: glycosyltransferase family 39 protein [Chloroflexota bacterium]